MLAYTIWGYTRGPILKDVVVARKNVGNIGTGTFRCVDGQCRFRFRYIGRERSKGESWLFKVLISIPLVIICVLREGG